MKVQVMSNCMQQPIGTIIEINDDDIHKLIGAGMVSAVDPLPQSQNSTTIPLKEKPDDTEKPKRKRKTKAKKPKPGINPGG